MKILASTMEEDVRIVIDMNTNSTALISEDDIDTLSLNDIIATKLCDGIRLAESEAPSFMLESDYSFANNTITWLNDGKGYVVLPNDFMRLVVFKMSDWERAVVTSISENTPEYLKQSSRWGGVRGNSEKPIVAIVNRKEGLLLEFYSCKDNTATIEQATYRPLPEIDENGYITISQLCYRGAVYCAASLVLATFENQLADTMLTTAKQLLNITG